MNLLFKAQVAMYACAAVFLVALAVCAIVVSRDVIQVVMDMRSELHAANMRVFAELDAARVDANAQLDVTRQGALALADKQLTGLRTDAKAELDAYRATADMRLSETLQRADAALQCIETLEKNTEPILAHANAITAHTDDATSVLFRRDALPAQLLGVTAAAKVTLGQTAKTMREIEAATPEIAANVQAATESSAKASEDTAKLMANLTAATKPLPKWLRIMLGVAPPIAETMAGAATAYIALH